MGDEKFHTWGFQSYFFGLWVVQFFLGGGGGGVGVFFVGGVSAALHPKIL